MFGHDVFEAFGDWIWVGDSVLELCINVESSPEDENDVPAKSWKMLRVRKC